jgi:excisionase family DNA binding protein
MDKVILSQFSLDELATAVAAKIKADVPAVPASSPMDEELMTAKEVSKLLGVSLVSISTWKKDGKLKFYQYGSRIRFKKSEVLQVEKYKGNKKG